MRKFSNFFLGKVVNTRALISPPSQDPSVLIFCVAVFDQFEPFSLSILDQLVASMKPTGSPIDIIPPRFLKEVFPTLGSCILTIINSSLTLGIVPKNFKDAVVHLLLKKPGLQPSNFRPVSKLPFLSKILGKTICTQLKSFLDDHSVMEVFQSDIYMATDW